MGTAWRAVRPGDLPDMVQEVVVSFRYPVRFTRGLLDPGNVALRRAGRG
ncbi:MAG TPA: hypothetical protein VHJ39_08135 [Solirubrobacteraceae bacterium]|jgi:hypothetical protein|nr:hypothetical protein [Solirubrobacteraceae bacterium]